MAELGSHALIRKLSDAIAAKWATDADFIARGTKIFTPRLRPLPDDTNVEIVDLQFPSIEFVETYSVSPQYEIRRALLQLSGLIDLAQTIDPDETEPTVALLALLAPFAELLEQKIEVTVREIRSDKAANPELHAQVDEFDFQSYETIVDLEGNRLRAAALFKYGVDLIVPHAFPELGDLEVAEVDFNLLDGRTTPSQVFPDIPHAEDTIGLYEQYLNAGAVDLNPMNLGLPVVVPFTGWWLGVVVNLQASPNADVVLTQWHNGSAATPTETVTIPAGFQLDRGLELLWDNPLQVTAGDLVEYRGDGGPTSAVPSTNTYKFRRS